MSDFISNLIIAQRCNSFGGNYEILISLNLLKDSWLYVESIEQEINKIRGKRGMYKIIFLV